MSQPQLAVPLRGHTTVCIEPRLAAGRYPGWNLAHMAGFMAARRAVGTTEIATAGQDLPLLLQKEQETEKIKGSLREHDVSSCSLYCKDKCLM